MPNIKFFDKRQQLQSNDFIDWKTIVPNIGGLLIFNGNLFTGKTNAGRDFGLMFDCRFTRNEQGPPGASWVGCFSPGDGVLCNGSIADPVVITFPTDSCLAAGAQMEPDAVVRANNPRGFVGYINLLDSQGMPVAGPDSFNGSARMLTFGDANDGSSTFLGAEWANGFSGLEFYAEVRKPRASTKAVKFAVNRIDLRF